MNSFTNSTRSETPTTKLSVGSRQWKKVLLSLGLCSILLPASSFAADTIFTVQDNSGHTLHCRMRGSAITSGSMKGSRFTAYADNANSLRSKIKKLKRKKKTRANNSAIKKAQASLKQLIALSHKEDPFCKASAPDSTPTPAPTASKSPTPAPTHTPTPTPRGSFDSAGNTTAFGIPAGTVGNVTRGKSLHSADCSICHEERLGRSFQDLQGALSRVNEMRSMSLSTSQMADIIAYLNRFK